MQLDRSGITTCLLARGATAAPASGERQLDDISSWSKLIHAHSNLQLPSAHLLAFDFLILCLPKSMLLALAVVL